MKTKSISFKCSKEDASLIGEIADRAVRMAVKYGVNYNHITANMDITACHSSGCPLRLQELLETDDSNFAHDVFGIRDKINRETGELEGFFVPRFAI